MVLVMVVGTALDMTPTILLLTPVLMPVVKAAGIDPVYFGVLFIINNAIGLITPPVGTVLNAVAGVGKVSMDEVTRGVLPFMVAQFVVMFLMVAFPQLVMAARWLLTLIPLQAWRAWVRRAPIYKTRAYRTFPFIQETTHEASDPQDPAGRRGDWPLGVAFGPGHQGAHAQVRPATRTPRATRWCMGMEKFAEIVEAKSGGKIKVNLFPGGTLGGDAGGGVGLQGGTVEMAVMNSGILASQVKDFEVYDFPFMFASEQGSRRRGRRPFGQKMHAKLADKGLVGLAYWELGFRNITNSKRPINKVEDIAGLKLRVIPNAINVDWVKAWAPTPRRWPSPRCMRRWSRRRSTARRTRSDGDRWRTSSSRCRSTSR
jgi:hypothetical protein